MKVKSEREVAQLCPNLSDPMDCSLPGSSIHGIFQARVLEWGAIAFRVSFIAQLVKNLPAMQETQVQSLGQEIPWKRRWQPTPVFLSGEPHGQRSLVGCSPWGHKESDTIEQLPFHFSLSCIGEGNGNPLQCSCLENPRDGGAWWAAVYGVAQSQTRLRQLSSSSSSSSLYN